MIKQPSGDDMATYRYYKNKEKPMPSVSYPVVYKIKKEPPFIASVIPRYGRFIESCFDRKRMTLSEIIQYSLVETGHIFPITQDDTKGKHKKTENDNNEKYDLDEGYIDGDLYLDSLPTYKDAAKFRYAFTKEVYNVAPGKAYDYVCKLIYFKAFDGREIHLGTKVSDAFKGTKRTFYTKKIRHLGKGFYTLLTK